jgi:hypothetical protein
MSAFLQRLLGLSLDDVTGLESWTLRLMGLPESLWAVMGMFAVFAALVWWTFHNYQREGHASRRIKLALAAVRSLVLLLLLLIAFHPAIVLRFTKEQPGKVVVLVDDSLSMRWADRDGDRSVPRLDAVRAAITRKGGALPQLAREHDLTLVRFSTTSDARHAYTDVLASCARQRSGDLATVENALATGAGQLTASGYHTNLGQAIRESLEKLEGQRIAAVVMISDGRNTSAIETRARLAAALQMVRDRGIPVFTVAVGDPTPPKNISVAQLQGPGEVRKGSTVVFTAFLSHRHFGGVPVEVKLWRAPAGSTAWEATGASESVTLGTGSESDEGAALQEVTLRADAPEVGTFVYKAEVAPQPDEMNKADNEATAAVRVSDEKVQVLLIGGDAGWEFQYIRNYLLGHPEHYKVSVWQQNADVRFNQEASSGMKLTSLPTTKGDLYAYDVIILYDPRYATQSVDQTFLGLLEEFVSSHHGGLCYIVGTKNTDQTLLGGGQFEGLTKILPVVLAHESALLTTQLRGRQTAWPVRLTSDGVTHPLMQLANTAAENEKLWADLPGLYTTHRVLRLKTLASALAVSTDPGQQTNDGQPAPVIALQYYGKGRVLYLGSNNTWRWRFVDDAKPYARFWGNAMDFLAQGRLEKKRILITTGGDAFDAGSEIGVRVEAYSRDFTPLPAKSLSVQMTREGTQETAEYQLQSTKPGFFEGAIPADRVGVFQITARAKPESPDQWLEEDVSTRRVEIRLPQEELRRPEADYATLREMAGSDDRFLKLSELDRLPQRLPSEKRVAVIEVPHALWNTMFMLVMLGVLLLTEWTVRKLYNLE